MKNFARIFVLMLSAVIGGFAQSNDGIVANNGILAKIGAQQTLTVNDLSLPAQQIVERLPQVIAETRQSELAKTVDELLFAAEAAVRKTTVEKLLDAEVRRKVVNPTPKQIQALYDANRQAFGDETLDEVKNRLVNYLRRDSETKVAASFASALKPKYQFVPGVDVNSFSLKPDDVLATVGAEKIVAAKFNERLQPLEYNLRLTAFQQLKPALDEAIYSNLILLEAKRQNLPPETIVKSEITDKLREPSEADARKFYDEQKAQFANIPFETAKTQILSYLLEDRRGKIENQLDLRLTKQYNVQVFLIEPTAPTLNIGANALAPSKGSPTAPVQIIMFTDFQCPACARMHPILSEVVKSYGAKIRFVVRNYPLVTVHENAFRAAQAAQAAHAQGKFFEYIDVLYKHQKALDDISLKKYAVQIGLNAKQFEADLNGGKFDGQIRQDIKDGELYGIRATPTIYLNGVILTGLTDADIKTLINKALAKKQ